MARSNRERDLPRCLELYRSGLSLLDVEAQAGVAKRTLIRWFKDAGEPMRPRGWPSSASEARWRPEQIVGDVPAPVLAAMARRSEAGESDADLALRYKLTIREVRARLRVAGRLACN